MVWIAFAAMTSAAVLCIVWPLVRPLRSRMTPTTDVDFYREQIAQLDLDVARGMLPVSDAGATRAELGRRLLSAAGRPEPFRAAGRERYAVAIAVLCLVPAFALGLYLSVGRPAYGDLPLAAREGGDQNIAALVERVEAHLAGHPEDARGYELVAPIYMRTGRFNDAARAFGEVLRLRGDTPERDAAYGQALVMAADGVVTQQARDAFGAALKGDPHSAQARFFVGLAAAQDGDKARARELWQSLVAEAPPNAEWLGIVRQRLASLDAGQASPAEVPSGPAAAGIASLPPGERAAAIRGMVDGLAARLAQNGHDPDGWLRLVRAYKVLGEEAKARQALTDARRSMREDQGVLSRLEGLARELGLEG